MTKTILDFLNPIINTASDKIKKYYFFIIIILVIVVLILVNYKNMNKTILSSISPIINTMFEKIKRYHVFIIIILVVVVLALISQIFILKKEITSLSQELSQELLPEAIEPQDFGAGEVGEVMVKDEKTGEQAPLVSPIMPLVISNTAGTIIEVKTDRVIIRGSGSNFADEKPRILTAVFTADTITFDKTSTFRQIGAVGLKRLEPGMQILIGSPENIRGKTEFKVKTIKIL